MKRILLLLAFLNTLVANADLTNSGWFDSQGYGITSNSSSGSRNAGDIEILVGGSIVDPRTRSWSLSSGTDSCSVVQSTTPWVSNISQFGGSNVVTGTGSSGSGVPRVTVANDSNILATQSGIWTVQQGSPPWTQNLTQAGGTNISTGTGSSGAGIPRVTVSNDSQVKIWDGTTNTTVKAASTVPGYTDTATVVTQRPDALGTVTQTSVSCATTSTTLLAGSTATTFIQIRNPTTATATVWIQYNGSAATAAAPSVDLAPGSEADFFAYGPSYLPTSQFNCISGGASASTLTLIYK